MASFDDLRFELRARLDDIERPWAAFLGLVQLQPSEYVKGDDIFAVNPPKPIWGDGLGQSVILHPDTVPLARAAAKTATGRELSDDELAALLYWLAHRLPRRDPSPK